MATKVYNNGEWKPADNAGVDSYGKTETYNKTEADAKFVNKSGDTMTGDLKINSNKVVVDDSETMTTSSGNIRAKRFGNLAIVSFFDIGITYAGSVQSIGTITVSTGWKMADCEEVRTTIIGDNGTCIKCWASGAGTNTITLYVWAQSTRTISLGNAQLVIPLKKD